LVRAGDGGEGCESRQESPVGAGVHGDELSPTDVVQRAFAELDPAKMSGAVIALFDISRPAMEFIQRKWPTNALGGSLVDMNRVWPGNENGSVTDRQARLVWNRLFKDNVDSVLDFHTAATGSDFTLFIFVDFRKPGSRQLAELFPVAQIKNDPGLTGTLETAFVEAGIPAITVEVGGPRSFDAPKIEACVEGVRNVLAHYGVTKGEVGRTAKDSDAFVGNDMEIIRASTGGFVELLVKLGAKVAAGQPVALQRNSFGDVLQQYKASVDGEVAILGTDALKEPGARIVEILTKNPDPKCGDGGCPYEGDEK
jgi:predicted deacylase